MSDEWAKVREAVQSTVGGDAAQAEALALLDQLEQRDKAMRDVVDETYEFDQGLTNSEREEILRITQQSYNGVEKALDALKEVQLDRD